MSAGTSGRHRAGNVSSAALLVDAVSRSSAPAVKVAATAAATTGVMAVVALPANAAVVPAVAAPQAQTAAVATAPAVKTPAAPVAATTTFGEMRFDAVAAQAKEAEAEKTTEVTTKRAAKKFVKKTIAKKVVTKKVRHNRERTVASLHDSRHVTAETTVSSSRSAARTTVKDVTAVNQAPARKARVSAHRASAHQAPAHQTPAHQTPARRASASGIIGLAQQFSGIYYVWGGTTPAGFDCSGFTQYLYGQLGRSLPRTAEAQRQVSTPISDPQVGDLVFFGAPAFHVGIYAGGGMMYDSPRTGKATGLHKIWSSNVSFGRL